MLEAIERADRPARPEWQDAMRGHDGARDEALVRLRELADETIEQARRVRKEASQAAGGAKDAHQQATSPRVRATLAKRRELAAHARAIKLHEQAAECRSVLPILTGPPGPARMPSMRGSSRSWRLPSSASKKGNAGRRV
jgi:hypothetical protein